MLYEICNEIHNFFSDDADRHFGKFTISGGNITPSNFLQNGQYFRIIGSALNDGVYQYPTSVLTDEEFEGAVWAMHVPPAFIALADDIKNYAEKESPTAYTSESFGGYSRSMAVDAHGMPATWRTVFASRLNAYRRLRP